MLAALTALSLLAGQGAPESADQLEGQVEGQVELVDPQAGDCQASECDGSAPAEAIEGQPKTKRVWIRHVVTPRERLSQIAARYGVRRDELVEWNKLASPRAQLRKGTRLRVLARQTPPPREKITYVVEDGDTWSSIAVKHRVDYHDLLAANWPRPKSLDAGLELTVWIDPGRPQTVNLKNGPSPPPLPEGLDGAFSRGKPARGRLTEGIQLPESELYERGHERWLWGSSHTLRNLITALGEFRYASGYEGSIIIGSISRRRGRRFPPHRSHQSGRDVDIRLPLLPGLPTTVAPNADEIDWSAAWELVRALVETQEVEVIFLEGPLQRRLYQAALWEGVIAEDLKPIIAWPNRHGNEKALVRHSRGHDGHIHVRFRCGPEEPRCRPRRRRMAPVHIGEPLVAPEVVGVAPAEVAALSSADAS